MGVIAMSETLLLGSRGEEVRRLQVNLNAALSGFIDRGDMKALDTDGKFGPHTRDAVILFQQQFHLKWIDGKVGPETRGALATRVVLIKGSMTRNMVMPPPAPQPPPSPPPNPPQPPTPPTPARPVQTASKFLLQLQPAFGLTPPAFVATSPTATVVSGQFQIGIVYRTAAEGPHWEFGGAGQVSVNSVNSVTDPRYTLQLQGSVAYADPLALGRFHTQLMGQVLLLQNIAPSSPVLGLGLGGQLSFDIIEDRWNIFLQGQAAGFWAPTQQQLLFGPLLGLGTTFQWGLP
jgi:hypothetical protein